MILKAENDKGVSLVELMLVITILAILVSFAASYFSDSALNAGITKAQKDLEAIKTAIKLYRVDTQGQYPPSIDALISKYLPARPIDPWGSAYQLDTTNYEVFCIVKNTGKKLSETYGLK